MGIAENKQTVLAFVELMSMGAPDPKYLCDDVSWWVPGLGEVDRAGFFALSDRFQSFVKTPAKMNITAVTAEEDRVAVQAYNHVPLKDGRIYANDYHLLFYLRDGRISHVREHNNSVVPASLFGTSLVEAVTGPDGAP